MNYEYEIEFRMNTLNNQIRWIVAWDTGYGYALEGWSIKSFWAAIAMLATEIKEYY